MGGWILFVAIAAVAGAALWRLGFPPALRSFALAAAALAGAGYAWQGRPASAGRPVDAVRQGTPWPDDVVAMRNAMLGRYGPLALYVTPADAMVRMGAPDAAARLLQGGINRAPRDFALWTQLGLVIASRDDGLSPAAAFAFARAAALAPREPGPWYFRGVAAVRGNALTDARAAWARALALTPATAGYRPQIAVRLTLLDALLAQGVPGR